MSLISVCSVCLCFFGSGLSLPHFLCLCDPLQNSFAVVPFLLPQVLCIPFPISFLSLTYSLHQCLAFLSATSCFSHLYFSSFLLVSNGCSSLCIPTCCLVHLLQTTELTRSRYPAGLPRLCSVLFELYLGELWALDSGYSIWSSDRKTQVMEDLGLRAFCSEAELLDCYLVIRPTFAVSSGKGPSAR